MRKYLFLLYLVFFISNILAQNKITPLKIKWKHDIWIDIFSINIFDGNNSGCKINFFKFRYKNIRCGLFTFFSHKLDLRVLAPDENKTYLNSLNYVLPIGYYIPIHKGNGYIVGLNFDFYLLPYMMFSDRDEERIEEKKLPKMFDFSLSFEHKFFTVSTGYRKQTEDWKLKFIDDSPIFYSRLDGFYIELGIGLTGGENESIKIVKISHEQKMMIESQIKKKLPSQAGIYIDSYKGYLQITVNLDNDKAPFNTDSQMEYTDKDEIRKYCEMKCIMISKAVLRVKHLPPLLGIMVEINHGITINYYRKWDIGIIEHIPYKSENLSQTIYSIKMPVKLINNKNILSMTDENIMKIWIVQRDIINELKFGRELFWNY